MIESHHHRQSVNGTAPLDHPSDNMRAEDPVPVSAADSVDAVQDVIRKYPAISMGIAVATGLALGWMVKRR